MPSRLTPAELGRDLRHGYSVFLNRRRSIIGLSFFSCAVLGTIAFYQIGILKKLPEPRLKRFDSAQVHGSGEAYSMLETPDAFLGLASYAVTATLAGMGSENRSQTHPWMALAMCAKLLADALMAGKLTLDELRKFKAFSLWSAVTAVATWTALPLAFPETRAALRQLQSHNHS